MSGEHQRCRLCVVADYPIEIVGHVFEHNIDVLGFSHKYVEQVEYILMIELFQAPYFAQRALGDSISQCRYFDLFDGRRAQ